MGKVAFVFSGQGDQRPGMGKELVEKYPAARDIFRICDRVRPGTSRQCFSGTAEELRRTENTQPCLFAMELALAEALRETGLTPDAVAGFSLGEVSACTFAGVFDYASGFSLAVKRGKLMQEAVEDRETAMAAVLRLSHGKVEQICASMRDVYPVNYNCPGQTTVATDAFRLPEFSEAVRKAGGRIMILPVGGGFHSPWMKGASEAFLAVLQKTRCRRPEMPVYSNVTAQPYPYPEEFRELLAAQIRKPVRWESLVLSMRASGIDTFIEIGPGNTLAGLIRKIDPALHTYSGLDFDRIRREVMKC